MRGWVAEPVLWILITGVLGLVLSTYRRGIGLAINALAVVLLYALATPFVSGHLLKWAELPYNPLAIHIESRLPPGAIVVLSAGRNRAAPEYGGETVDRLTLERVRHAARVARETGLPVLISGGSLDDDETSVAHLMKTVLEEDFGVPVRWVEDRSRDTMENARFSADILKSQNIGAVILVTSAFHMRRATDAFESTGIDVVPAGTGFTYVGPGLIVDDFVPSTSALLDSAYALHELIGLLGYRAFYY